MEVEDGNVANGSKEGAVDINDTNPILFLLLLLLSLSLYVSVFFFLNFKVVVKEREERWTVCEGGKEKDMNGSYILWDHSGLENAGKFLVIFSVILSLTSLSIFHMISYHIMARTYFSLCHSSLDPTNYLPDFFF